MQNATDIRQLVATASAKANMATGYTFSTRWDTGATEEGRHDLSFVDGGGTRRHVSVHPLPGTCLVSVEWVGETMGHRAMTADPELLAAWLVWWS